MEQVSKVAAKVTVPEVLARKGGGQPLTVLTAYDYTFARLFDAAEIDILLVGDSLGTVIQGEETTLPVTIEDMIYHTRAVRRAVRRALVVTDMPFLSFQISVEKAIEAAGRLLKEGGAQAVKLEGGVAIAETVARLVTLDIPVMGHVGLTPQSVNRMGGFQVQGRQSTAKGAQPAAGSRERVMQDALAVAEAGAFAIVLEGLPMDLAEEITARVSVPTIGIGAGPGCDGQVLVSYDMLGFNPWFTPRFVKRFMDGGALVTEATKSYIAEVRAGTFPAIEHSFSKPRIDTRKREK